MTRESAEAPPQKVQLSRTKTIIYSLLPVLLLLFTLEAGARLREFFVPPMDVDLGQGFTGDSLVFAPAPFDPGYRITHPHKTIAFQDQRFLAKKPEGTLRIAALGGSSVNYLDYEFSEWGSRLRDQLPGIEQVEIINCGGLSYGSHRLVLIAAEMLEYDIDLLMLYSGHNEFEELEQLEVAHVDLVPVQRQLQASALYRLLRDIATWRQIQQLKQQNSDIGLAAAAPDTSTGWMHQFTDEEISTRMATYRDNLARIITLCRDKDVPVVIGTVPSNLWKMPVATTITRWAEVEALYAERKFEEGRTLAEALLREGVRHQASEAENEVIRELGQLPGVSLADVKAAIIAAEPNRVPGETLFSDHCHLNPAGNKILIQTYEPLIVRELQERVK